MVLSPYMVTREKRGEELVKINNRYEIDNRYAFGMCWGEFQFLHSVYSSSRKRLFLPQHIQNLEIVKILVESKHSVQNLNQFIFSVS